MILASWLHSQLHQPVVWALMQIWWYNDQHSVQLSGPLWLFENCGINDLLCMSQITLYNHVSGLFSWARNSWLEITLEALPRRIVTIPNNHHHNSHMLPDENNVILFHRSLTSVTTIDSAINDWPADLFLYATYDGFRQAFCCDCRISKSYADRS